MSDLVVRPGQQIKAAHFNDLSASVAKLQEAQKPWRGAKHVFTIQVYNTGTQTIEDYCPMFPAPVGPSGTEWQEYMLPVIGTAEATADMLGLCLIAQGAISPGQSGTAALSGMTWARMTSPNSAGHGYAMPVAGSKYLAAAVSGPFEIIAEYLTRWKDASTPFPVVVNICQSKGRLVVNIGATAINAFGPMEIVDIYGDLVTGDALYRVRVPEADSLQPGLVLFAGSVGIGAGQYGIGYSAFDQPVQAAHTGCTATGDKLGTIIGGTTLDASRRGFVAQGLVSGGGGRVVVRPFRAQPTRILSIVIPYGFMPHLGPEQWVAESQANFLRPQNWFDSAYGDLTDQWNNFQVAEYLKFKTNWDRQGLESLIIAAGIPYADRPIVMSSGVTPDGVIMQNLSGVDQLETLIPIIESALNFDPEYFIIYYARRWKGPAKYEPCIQSNSVWGLNIPPNYVDPMKDEWWWPMTPVQIPPGITPYPYNWPYGARSTLITEPLSAWCSETFPNCIQKAYCYITRDFTNPQLPAMPYDDYPWPLGGDEWFYREAWPWEWEVDPADDNPHNASYGIVNLMNGIMRYDMTHKGLEWRTRFEV